MKLAISLITLGAFCVSISGCGSSTSSATPSQVVELYLKRIAAGDESSEELLKDVPFGKVAFDRVYSKLYKPESGYLRRVIMVDSLGSTALVDLERRHVATDRSPETLDTVRYRLKKFAQGWKITTWNDLRRGRLNLPKDVVGEYIRRVTSGDTVVEELLYEVPSKAIEADFVLKTQLASLGGYSAKFLGDSVSNSRAVIRLERRYWIADTVLWLPDTIVYDLVMRPSGWKIAGWSAPKLRKVSKPVSE